MILAGFIDKPQGDKSTSESFQVGLFSTIGKNAIESENNFTVIGSGRESARKVLDKRGQNPYRSWQRTAIDIIEAMDAARKTDSHHVGVPDDLFIIQKVGFRRFPSTAPYVKKIRKGIIKDKPPGNWDFVPKAKSNLENLLFDAPSSVP